MISLKQKGLGNKRYSPAIWFILQFTGRKTNAKGISRLKGGFVHFGFLGKGIEFGWVI